ncbi:MAG: hypothetical protein HZB18_01900 [Chloroflexi bacterium]|nr:hypothetical protein [Chloroflexota bacterium]
MAGRQRRGGKRESPLADSVDINRKGWNVPKVFSKALAVFQTFGTVVSNGAG